MGKSLDGNVRCFFDEFAIFIASLAAFPARQQKAAWVGPLDCSYHFIRFHGKLEHPTGFEPATACLENRGSTTELRVQNWCGTGTFTPITRNIGRGPRVGGCRVKWFPSHTVRHYLRLNLRPRDIRQRASGFNAALPVGGGKCWEWHHLVCPRMAASMAWRAVAVVAAAAVLQHHNQRHLMSTKRTYLSMHSPMCRICSMLRRLNYFKLTHQET